MDHRKNTTNSAISFAQKKIIALLIGIGPLFDHNELQTSINMVSEPGCVSSLLQGMVPDGLPSPKGTNLVIITWGRFLR